MQNLKPVLTPLWRNNKGGEVNAHHLSKNFVIVVWFLGCTIPKQVDVVVVRKKFSTYFS